MEAYVISNTVCNRTITRCESAQDRRYSIGVGHGKYLSVGLVDPFYDIDVSDDLTRLTAELWLRRGRRAPRCGLKSGNVWRNNGEV
jgi:hypothetical protein